MKLVFLKKGFDGELTIVFQGFSKSVLASDIATTLQDAIDECTDSVLQIKARFQVLTSNSSWV